MRTTDLKRQSSKRATTMSDIARKAGCSQATVSLVLNGKTGAHISPKTRQRVFEAARSLGYSKKPAKRVERAIAPRSFIHGRAPADRTGSQTGKVVQEIGMAIISGQFSENSLLPRDVDLMTYFGVSRTVLREAMKILSGKQLLSARARVGTRVRRQEEWNLFDPDILSWLVRAGLTDDFIRHIGEFRLGLEPEAAALAALRRSEKDLQLLYSLVDRMEAAGASASDFIAADLKVHLAIANTTENPFMRGISTLIEVTLVASLTRSWPGEEVGGVARSAAKHRAVVDAIADRDADAARAAMRLVIGEGIARATGSWTGEDVVERVDAP